MNKDNDHQEMVTAIHLDTINVAGLYSSNILCILLYWPKNLKSTSWLSVGPSDSHVGLWGFSLSCLVHINSLDVKIGGEQIKILYLFFLFILTTSLEQSLFIGSPELNLRHYMCWSSAELCCSLPPPLTFGNICIVRASPLCPTNSFHLWHSSGAYTYCSSGTVLFALMSP